MELFVTIGRMISRKIFEARCKRKLKAAVKRNVETMKAKGLISTNELVDRVKMSMAQ